MAVDPFRFGAVSPVDPANGAGNGSICVKNQGWDEAKEFLAPVPQQKPCHGGFCWTNITELFSPSGASCSLSIRDFDPESPEERMAVLQGLIAQYGVPESWEFTSTKIQFVPRGVYLGDVAVRLNMRRGIRENIILTPGTRGNWTAGQLWLCNIRRANNP